MKIILIKDVKKQGKKGDILDVRDGYANFLIKNKFAVSATNNSLDRLDRENKEKEHEEQLQKEAAIKIKEKLEKLNVSFKVKTGAGDKVFGSVSQKQIVEELKSKGFTIDKKQIRLKEALSTLGVHIVDIELYKGVIANIKIQLVK